MMKEEVGVKKGPRCTLDPLGLELFVHHRELASPKLLGRLLPVIAGEPQLPAGVRRARLAKTFLGSLIKETIARVTAPPVETPPQHPTLRQLMAEVSAKHGVDEHTIRCKMRVAYIVKIRNEFFYRAAKETLHSYPSIGRFCGGRDHTTVMYAISAHCRDHDLEHPRGTMMAMQARAYRTKKWTEARSALRAEARA